MSKHLQRRVQRIAVLLGQPIGYVGPEGECPGPEGAERVELVHPSGKPAAWLVGPAMPAEQRLALVGLTSERLSLVAALEVASQRPGLEDMLGCLSGCERGLAAARTPSELAHQLAEGLRTLLALVDRDALDVAVTPTGDPAGEDEVQLDADGRTLWLIVGAEVSGWWRVCVTRPASGEHRQAAVLHRAHMSACDLFRRQVATSLRAWHLARIDEAHEAILAAFRADWARKSALHEDRVTSFQGCAQALHEVFQARGVRLLTLHRATLTREVRGEAGAVGGDHLLRVPLLPQGAVAADGGTAESCLPIGEVEVYVHQPEDIVGWGPIARALAVRLADLLCNQRRLRLAERALEPLSGPATDDPWQTLVSRLQADLALSAACVVDLKGRSIEVSAGEGPFVAAVAAALHRPAMEAPQADRWQRWGCGDLELWLLPVPGPDPERRLALAARRDAAWSPSASVLGPRDRDFARHVLDPFLAQMQTLDAIPHASILLHSEAEVRGMANRWARELLGGREDAERLVRKLVEASAVPGVPAWVEVADFGLYVWRPTGTSHDLLLFSRLDGLLALDRALTLERLTSTSFLHHLRTLVKVTQQSAVALRSLFTHGALSTIAEALEGWPAALPDISALFERLSQGDQGPEVPQAVTRWRALGFGGVGPRLRELAAAVCDPGAPLAAAELRLLRALDAAHAPEVLADALLRIAQIAHHLRGVGASLRQLDADRKLLDPREGEARERSLRFLVEDVEDLARVMVGLEEAPVELEFCCDPAWHDLHLPHTRLVEHALLNLVGNAVQSVAKRGGGRVQVSMTREGDFLHVQVKDDGVPLPEAIAAAPYLPPTADAAARGWGLHLTFAIVERLGGRMPLPTLESSVEDPSRQQKIFELRLPLGRASEPT